MSQELSSQNLRIAGASLGHTVIFKEITGSTNDDAREMAEAGAAHGTVVVADRQESGRGRLGRKWVSPAATNLLISIILRERVGEMPAGLITIGAGVAVARALAGNYSIRPGLKWPNDVMVFGRKLAGILAEAGGRGRIEYVILGMGINVNLKNEDVPAQLRNIATSLREETGKRWDRAEVFKAVLAELEKVMDDLVRGNPQRVLREWEALSASRGKRLHVETPAEVFAGIEAGLREDGALLVMNEQGREKAVVAGTITIVD